MIFPLHKPQRLPDDHRQNIGRALIKMRDIVKTFDTPVGSFTALKEINTEFQRGEFVAVVGKSGSGKSTLANMLTGIDRPTSGEVEIGGTDIHRLSESKMAKWRGLNLGIVFQFYQLMPMLSLYENVLLPMQIAGRYTLAERQKRAKELLAMVDLEKEAHQMPAEVAGGQQQSAAIARALANDPPLIVADEPTGNLDSGAANTIFNIFEDLSRQGKTIVMVTHDNELAQRATRKLLIADGEIIDESVAKALPLLTHQQMLSATRQIQVLAYKPDQLILQDGQDKEKFFIIRNGQVQVSFQDKNHINKTTTNLSSGEYFGEAVFQLNGWRSEISLHAIAKDEVEVLALPSQFFLELMADANDMRQEIVHSTHQTLNNHGKVSL
jgi:ABC-type lipoprotein export system ATPase subunit